MKISRYSVLFTIFVLAVSFFFAPVSDARSQFPVDLDPELCTLAEEWQIQARYSYEFENVLRQWYQSGLLADEPSFDSYVWTMFHTVGCKVWTVHMVMSEFLTPSEFIECLGMFNFYQNEFPQNDMQWNEAISRSLHPVEVETILARAAGILATKSDHVPDMISQDMQFLLRDDTRIVNFYAPRELGVSRILEGTIQIESSLIVTGEWYDIYIPYQQEPISVQCTANDVLKLPRGLYSLGGGISVYHHSKSVAEQGFAMMGEYGGPEYPAKITLTGKTKWYGAEKSVDQTASVLHTLALRIDVLLSKDNTKITIVSEIEATIIGGQIIMTFGDEAPESFNMSVSFGELPSTYIIMTRGARSNDEWWYNFELKNPFSVPNRVERVIQFNSPPVPITTVIISTDGFFDIRYSPSASGSGGSGGSVPVAGDGGGGN
ncbi:hypothetical protein A2477_01240 [Candidatus Falkowbacteria bacterium RIFOXYC2_FULL_47_12]|uniref:Uncharacterized protein n=2 Tax=Candidatus Falkowiibacteriota TaxID=1752728 RepID=A0A1F5TLQ7_9BACT|nr:MAG: hypothetical protein A2242_02605 [Candidatus Falkowbacteria bacterium RIFOXYA2_FULL_47_9]OGF39779.1 MAG: hypothetical protein A2477_01240 [Candidatus Falkowbacteria bacterium RIFOXYC2_FULL_47_12]